MEGRAISMENGMVIPKKDIFQAKEWNGARYYISIPSPILQGSATLKIVNQMLFHYFAILYYAYLPNYASKLV